MKDPIHNCCICKHFRMWKPKESYCTVKKDTVEPLKENESCWVMRKGLRMFISRKLVMEELLKLLEYMKSKGEFNAAIDHFGEVTWLELVDNGVGWRAVINQNGNINLYFHSDIRHKDLSIEEAGDLLLGYYGTSKVLRVVEREAKRLQSLN